MIQFRMSALAAVAAVMLGCGKQSGDAPAPVVAAPPPKPSAAPAAPAVPPTASTADSPKPAKDENPDLTALNAAFRKFWQDTQSPPANLDILVKRGYLKTMPVPPKGKRFVLNWEKMEVTLAPQ